MKKVKRSILVLAVILMLVSSVVTVYAVSAEPEQNGAPSGPEVQVTADYAAEEMAVEAYYQNI